MVKVKRFRIMGSPGRKINAKLLFYVLILYAMFIMVMLHRAFYSQKRCHCKESLTDYSAYSNLEPLFEMHQTFSTNLSAIKIYDLLDHIHITYPSYLWSHTGWIETLDAHYSVQQWEFNKLIVHVIPFSHNDPGWKMTSDEYFYVWTKNILDLILDKLTQNKEMTFVWSEIIFLKKWYNQLTLTNQHFFKNLIREGRFEILTGGMVMVDEALVHYEAIIDQLGSGHQWIHDELNLTVESAWSIDSFGHSPTVAYIMKKSGIRNLFIQRTHYSVKTLLASQKMIEFNWKINQDSLFTHMNPFTLYSTTFSCGPDIDVCCQFDFIHNRCWKWGHYVEAEEITEENLDSKSRALLDQLRKKNQFVNHNNVYLLVGDDFSFAFASEWDNQWRNMVKLFDYMNDNINFNVEFRFSTMGKYLKSVEHDLKKMNYSVQYLEGDFFPYSDRSNQYWSGYYSSRPFLKLLIRKCQSLARLTDLLLSFSSLKILKMDGKNFSRFGDLIKTFNDVRMDYHSFQHHDIITGTSKASVVADVLNKLNNFLLVSNKIINVASSFLFHDISLGKVILQMDEKPMFKSSDVLRSISVLNPLSRPIHQIIKVLTNSINVTVEDENELFLPCQINPIIDKSFFVKSDIFELNIKIELQAFSISTFKIRLPKNNSTICAKAKLKLFQVKQRIFQKNNNFQVLYNNQDYFNMSNNYFELHFCSCCGSLQSVSFENHVVETRIDFSAYRTGLWFKPHQDKSGAYIFLPNGESMDISKDDVKTVMLEGPVESSVTNWFSHLSNTIKIYHDKGYISKYISLHNYIDIRSESNYELALKIRTSIKNENFWTDLNGYKAHKRRYRYFFPISGNFYPISNFIFIEDKKHRISLLTNMGQAASSLHKGEMEVLLDRRLKQDDWRGLNEGVMDNQEINLNFMFTFEKLQSDANKHESQPSHFTNNLMNELNHPAVILNNKINSFNTNGQLVKMASLSNCIHIVSCRIYSIDITGKIVKVLITLHYSTIDPTLANINFSCFNRTQLISIKSIFGSQNVFKIFETNLTGTILALEILSGFLTISQSEIKSWIVVSSSK